jgi:hypothetical protein
MVGSANSEFLFDWAGGLVWVMLPNAGTAISKITTKVNVCSFIFIPLASETS